MASKSVKGMAIASAAAGLFMLGTTMAASSFAADEAKVACEGVNACKGTSDCKTAKSSCKGQNACKGQGQKQLTKAECDKAAAEAKK